MERHDLKIARKNCRHLSASKQHWPEIACLPGLLVNHLPLGTTRLDIESAHQEKIPARNAMYAQEQDFAASDDLLLAILKAFIPQLLNKQQTIGFHVF
jgi:hypothetical protein